MGDDLIESFPYFGVTARMGIALSQARLTGFRLNEMEVEVGYPMNELYPGATLPEFKWLVIEGEAYKSDFGMNDELALVVSDRALSVLRQGKLAHCDVEKANP